MPVMQNSDSSFPVDWPPIQMGEILLEVKEKVGRTRSDDVPILSMTRHDGLVLQSDKFDKRVASRDISNYKIVRRDQIVVGFPIDEGVVYALRRFPIGAVSPAYQVWKVVRSDIDIEFLDTMLKTPLMISRYRQLSSLTVQRRRSLGKQDFLNLEIPLPPLPEQRRIAAVLNAIQDAIAAQEDVIAAARQFKRSLMQRLFTYGPGRQPAETKATEIGEIPAHWDVVKLGQVASISTGTTPSTAKPEYYVGTNAYIKTTNISNSRISGSNDFVSDEAISAYGLKVYPPGTILMAMYGQGKTRGQVSICDIPVSTTQNAAAMIVGDDFIPDCLWQYLLSQYHRLRGAGIEGHISHLNLGYVKELPIPCPEIEEQSLIVRMLDAADAKVAAEEDRKTALEALFKSMLHQLMTGQIRLLSDEGLPLADIG